MKNLLLIIILSSLISPALSWASNQENDKNKKIDLTSTPQSSFDHNRWNQIMKLVDGEIKTIKQNKYSGPDLKHRLFELYSEKIKLIKEKENLSLLSAKAEDLVNNGKANFFKASNQQFKTAQGYAKTIIAQYPKYKHIDLIYYAMAINSRDYDESKDTENYLIQSIRFAKSDSKTLYNSKTALAEYYYNNKRYKDAIAYYKDVLKNTDNEWYAKHLYNAGWCELKQRNFKVALDYVKESFEVAKNPKYISMNEQIFQAIGIFFVQADKTHEGIEFYQKNSPQVSTHLISLAQSTMSKNTFALTQDVLQAALNDTKKRKNANDEMKVRLAQINIYKENKKDELFFETSNDILSLYKKNKLEEDDIFEAKNKIKEVAGFMQINLIRDKLADPVKFEMNEYNKIMRYFDILTVIDRPNKKINRYYQGETALSTHQFDIALKYYVRAILNAKIEKSDDEITKKSIDALLSTLERAKLSKKKEREYSVFALKNYVLFYPISDKSQVVYQKLFNTYFEQKDLKRAHNILAVYEQKYPTDIEIHRNMLTQVLEFHIKNKHTQALAYWINRIEKGHLAFDKKYIEKSIAILGNLLFEKYQALEKSGHFKMAVKGYESIYDSKKYPNTTKAQAAYAIATLSLELNNANDTKKWLKRSFEYFQNEDILKITKSILEISKGLRLLQEFNYSQELTLVMLNKLCKVDDKIKNDFYIIANENSLTNQSSIKSLTKIEEDFSHCELSKDTVLAQKEQNFMSLIFLDDYKNILLYYKENQNNEKMNLTLTSYLKEKFYSMPDQITKDVNDLKGIDLSQSIEQFASLREFISSVYNFKTTLTSKDVFDEETYNSELEQYFSMINELNEKAVKLAKKSGPEEVIMLRKYLSKPYLELAKNVENYIPKGVEKEYQEGFKASMRQITESLVAKASQLDREKVSFLEKNNYFFQVQKNDIFGLEKNKGSAEELRKLLTTHSASLFVNTLDVANSARDRKLAGN